MGHVLHYAGTDSVEADKAETSHDFLCPKQFRQSLLVSEAVLQSKNCRVRLQQGSNETLVAVIGCSFQANYDQVHRADFLRESSTTGKNLEISLRTEHLNPLFTNELVVRP